MKHLRSPLDLLLLGLFAVTLSSENAFAYIDPGTGSYVFQAVIAGIVAGAYGIRMYWVRIKALFIRPAANRADKSHTIR